METTKKIPDLVASTNDLYSCSILESRRRERVIQAKGSELHQAAAAPIPTGSEYAEANYFKSAQWTPDGTSLLTSSADNTIRTFILPPTLLDNPTSPASLTPYTTHLFPTTVNCLALYPYYTLSEPTTTLYLSAPSSLPVRLSNTLSPTAVPLATYSLVCPTTEAYLTPSSIFWSAPGTSFLTGTDCLISVFDISRNGSGPSTRLPTIPSKRHKMKGGGVGMRGIISALSLQADNDGQGILAAGTWTRWVGLYDAAGMGGTVATWSIAEAADGEAGIGGTGIAQTGWSRCGKYMWVAERKSRGVLVYDVRVTGKLVCWLEGREGDTNQRLGVDSFEGENGLEIWSGGTDGVVRIWEGVGSQEGGCKRNWEWKAHDDPISSTVLHNTGTVVATCSGQRSEPYWNGGSTMDYKNSSDSSSDDETGSDDESSSSGSEEETSTSVTPPPPSRMPDNTLKVWSL
ncbi:wd repeat-containing 79 protein [Rutstroemia sp. NJR-2017a BBW]|nr:wd repeat-containing 79 protein [Rutstroemia sp. NJR-2017a BBW]